jgi:hypothetical protein
MSHGAMEDAMTCRSNLVTAYRRRLWAKGSRALLVVMGEASQLRAGRRIGAGAGGGGCRDPTEKARMVEDSGGGGIRVSNRPTRTPTPAHHKRLSAHQAHATMGCRPGR